MNSNFHGKILSDHRVCLCVPAFLSWTPAGMNKNTHSRVAFIDDSGLAVFLGRRPCYLRSLLRLSLAALLLLLGEIGAHLTCSLTHIDSHFWIRKGTRWVKKAAPRLRDSSYGEFTQPRARRLDHSCWELADKERAGRGEDQHRRCREFLSSCLSFRRPVRADFLIFIH